MLNVDIHKCRMLFSGFNESQLEKNKINENALLLFYFSCISVFEGLTKHKISKHLTTRAETQQYSATGRKTTQ